MNFERQPLGLRGAYNHGIVIKLATERTQSADEDCVILPRALEKLLTEPLQM